MLLLHVHISTHRGDGVAMTPVDVSALLQAELEVCLFCWFNVHAGCSFMSAIQKKKKQFGEF